MTISEALKQGEYRLRAVPDPRLDAEYLLAHVLGLPRLRMLTEKGRALTDEEAAAFDALLRRREEREPLQYILGSQSFMGFSLRTDPRALIPRNDTEAVCETALDHLAAGQRALDLCTGTGAIAIALKKLRPGAQVTAADVSEDALALARENARRLGADVRFLRGDLFAPVEKESFHLIVSNPPYIPVSLRGKLQPEVEREPALALFAGEDGLDFYRRIAREAPRHLLPGGHLVLETGDGQAEAVCALLEGAFQHLRVFRDLNGLPRGVCGEKSD